MTRAPQHFSALARRTSEPASSWLMKLALDRSNLISLAAGFTDNETLPVEEVKQITREILRRPKTALHAGVLYVPGKMCYCNNPSHRIPQNCIRLSFGAPSVEQIRKSIRVLVDVIRRFS